MNSKLQKITLKDLDPEDILLKYKNFDYELYINNYCLKENGGYDDKVKAWTHYLLFGEPQQLIYFDITNKGKYDTMKINFDFQLYIDNYNLKENGGYDNFNKALWHYVNLGENNNFIYFDINNRAEYEKQQNDFDDVEYLNKYFFLKNEGYDTHDKLWWHYLNIGKKNGLFYFDKKQIQDNNNIYKKNILYCVSTSNNNNNEIKQFVKNVANIIGNYFLEYNLFLVTIDEKNQGFRLMNDKEIGVFFYQYSDLNNLNQSFEKKNILFNKIKNNKDTILFIPEIYSNTYLLLDIILRKFKNIGIKTIAVYYNDTIYDDNILNENKKYSMFNEYITVMSKFDVIIHCFKNSEDTYLGHLNRLNINKKQVIQEITNFNETSFKNMTFHLWNKYTKEILEMVDTKYNEYIINIESKLSNQKTVYYYLENTCKNKNITDIEITSIYLAKQFIKNIIFFNFQVIFVKWDNTKLSLVPCTIEELKLLFNFEETEDLVEDIIYNNYLPIHLNTEIPIDKCVFFCPQKIIYDITIITNLPKYLKKYNIKNIFILYDIIPLALESYNTCLNKEFELYFFNILLNSTKIIPISNFTKIELINYCYENNTNQQICPSIKDILLPFQYKNTEIITNEIKNYNKIIILVPGKIEERKQQIVIFEQFVKFVNNYPDVNVEMIAFGDNLQTTEHIELYYKLNDIIITTNNKFKYLGIIDNKTLFDLYNKASFTCFISYYEGFSFQVTESLCHKIPVLTSNFGSMIEIAEHGGCYTINTNDINEIYNGLESLILNPELIEKLKSEIITTNYQTWFDYAEKIYQEIIQYF